MTADELATQLREATEPVTLEKEQIKEPLNLIGVEIKVPASLKNFTFEGSVGFSLSSVAGNLDLSQVVPSRQGYPLKGHASNTTLY